MVKKTKLKSRHQITSNSCCVMNSYCLLLTKLAKLCHKSIYNDISVKNRNELFEYYVIKLQPIKVKLAKVVVCFSLTFTYEIQCEGEKGQLINFIQKRIKYELIYILTLYFIWINLVVKVDSNEWKK